MKIRNITLLIIPVFFLMAFLVLPQRSFAGTDNITAKVMSDKVKSANAAPDERLIEVTRNRQSRSELQVRLGDALKAYVSGSEEPNKDLNGKPLGGNYRALFGFHIRM